MSGYLRWNNQATVIPLLQGDPTWKQVGSSSSGSYKGNESQWKKWQNKSTREEVSKWKSSSIDPKEHTEEGDKMQVINCHKLAVVWTPLWWRVSQPTGWLGCTLRSFQRFIPMTSAMLWRTDHSDFPCPYLYTYTHSCNGKTTQEVTLTPSRWLEAKAVSTVSKNLQQNPVWHVHNFLNQFSIFLLRLADLAGLAFGSDS